MANAIIGLCTIELHLPGLTSLKAKRGILKSMQSRLRKSFNVSVAEIDHQDVWQSAVIAIVSVSNSSTYNYQVIHKVIHWIEENYPDALIVGEDIEIL